MSHAGPPPSGPEGPQGPQGPLGPPGFGPPSDAATPPPPQGPSDGVWTIHPHEPTPPPKRSKAPLIIGISTAVVENGQGIGREVSRMLPRIGE